MLNPYRRPGNRQEKTREKDAATRGRPDANAYLCSALFSGLPLAQQAYLIREDRVRAALTCRPPFSALHTVPRAVVQSGVEPSEWLSSNPRCKIQPRYSLDVLHNVNFTGSDQPFHPSGILNKTCRLGSIFSKNPKKT